MRFHEERGDKIIVFSDLVYSLKKLVNLEFLLPRVEYVEGPPPKVERVDKRRSTVPNRQNVIENHNSNITLTNVTHYSDVVLLSFDMYLPAGAGLIVFNVSSDKSTESLLKFFE